MMGVDPSLQHRIRVCHVITLLELGGAQQNTLFTLSHLDRTRFEPMLIAGEGGILEEEAKRIPLLPTAFLPELVRGVNPVKDAKALFRMVSLMGQWRPDIVHTHSSKAGILGRWAAHLSGVPAAVHTIHGFGFHPEQGRAKNRLFRGLEAATSKVTTHFLAVSQANLEAGIAFGLFPRGRVTLVRSGVDLSALKNGVSAGNLRSSLGIPPGAPIAGMVGCLKPQKAPVDWVRVAERVSRRVPSAHFLLAGDGELRGEVEREVSALGLGGRFHLLGWRRDIPKILKNLSVFVLTSLWEGLPRVIPEAMAAGLPVVATRVDGTPEVVCEGETGYLVPPHDLDRMAERVAELLGDPQAARRMGAKARSRLQEFDIEEMVGRQERIYEQLLANG